MEPRALPAGAQRGRRARGAGDGAAMRGPGRAALCALLLAQVAVQQAPACSVGPAAASPGSPSGRRPPGSAEWPAWMAQGEYELVSPYEVDHNGDYVSHEITHPQRRKRALAQLGVESLHLRLKGFRHDFHMELKASNLVAPGFMVQTLGKGGTKSVHAFPPEDFCFYQGSLRSHKNSSVALSTCKGLSGMIRTQEADYFLKPLPSQLAGTPGDAAGAGPPSHILYKRSADERAPGAPQAVVTQRDRELGTPHLHGGSTLQHPQKQHFCGRRKKCM